MASSCSNLVAIVRCAPRNAATRQRYSKVPRSPTSSPISVENDTQAHSRRDAQHCQGGNGSRRCPAKYHFSQSKNGWLNARSNNGMSSQLHSSLLGQKFPHPLLGGRLFQGFHCTVRVQHSKHRCGN